MEAGQAFSALFFTSCLPAFSSLIFSELIHNPKYVKGLSLLLETLAAKNIRTKTLLIATLSTTIV